MRSAYRPCRAVCIRPCALEMQDLIVDFRKPKAPASLEGSRLAVKLRVAGLLHRLLSRQCSAALHRQDYRDIQDDAVTTLKVLLDSASQMLKAFLPAEPSISETALEMNNSRHCVHREVHQTSVDLTFLVVVNGV